MEIDGKGKEQFNVAGKPQTKKENQWSAVGTGRPSLFRFFHRQRGFLRSNKNNKKRRRRIKKSHQSRTLYTQAQRF